MIEFAADRREGRDDTIGFDFVENLPDFVWLLPCLFQQACLAKLDEHSLSPCGNETRTRLDQDLSRTDRGAGDLDQFRLARSQRLQYLSHPCDSPIK